MYKVGKSAPCMQQLIKGVRHVPAGWLLLLLRSLGRTTWPCITIGLHPALPEHMVQRLNLGLSDKVCEVDLGSCACQEMRTAICRGCSEILSSMSSNRKVLVQFDTTGECRVTDAPQTTHTQAARKFSRCRLA